MYVNEGILTKIPVEDSLRNYANSIGNPGEEYGDGGTTSVSNGRMPDLGLFENP